MNQQEMLRSTVSFYLEMGAPESLRKVKVEDLLKTLEYLESMKVILIPKFGTTRVIVSSGTPSLSNIPKKSLEYINPETMRVTIDNGEIIEKTPISEEEMEKFDEQAFEGIEPEPELEPLEAIPISTEVMQGILNNFAFSVNAALRGRAPTPGYTVTMMVPANGQYIFESIANRLEELESMRKDAERYRFLRDPGRWNSSGGSFVTLTRLSLGDFDNFVDKLIKIEKNI